MDEPTGGLPIPQSVPGPVPASAAGSGSSVPQHTREQSEGAIESVVGTVAKPDGYLGGALSEHVDSRSPVVAAIALGAYRDSQRRTEALEAKLETASEEKAEAVRLRYEAEATASVAKAVAPLKTKIGDLETVLTTFGGAILGFGLCDVTERPVAGVGAIVGGIVCIAMPYVLMRRRKTE
jgi:hypothetical protein